MENEPMHILKKAARISQVLMGVIFLAAGLIKIWDAQVDPAAQPASASAGD